MWFKLFCMHLTCWSRGSLVSIGWDFFLFATASRPAVGPTHSPIQWVPGAFTTKVKRSVREADHSPPSRAEVKISWSYTYTPTIRPYGVVLS
jgi:hypothetical protein